MLCLLVFPIASYPAINHSVSNFTMGGLNHQNMGGLSLPRCVALGHPLHGRQGFSAAARHAVGQTPTGKLRFLRLLRCTFYG